MRVMEIFVSACRCLLNSMAVFEAVTGRSYQLCFKHSSRFGSYAIIWVYANLADLHVPSYVSVLNLLGESSGEPVGFCSVAS